MLTMQTSSFIRKEQRATQLRNTMGVNHAMCMARWTRMDPIPGAITGTHALRLHSRGSLHHRSDCAVPIQKLNELAC